MTHRIDELGDEALHDVDRSGVRPCATRILIIANASVTPDDDLEALYQFACARIEFLERELSRELSLPTSVAGPPLDVRSNITRERFLEMVRTAKEYIAAGDIYQVVLSQRFEVDVTADPFTVYRALRHVNPSPYMYFIRMGGAAIVGSSPEMLVRVEGRRAQTHPIAGPVPGSTEKEDVSRVELKTNEKSAPSVSCGLGAEIRPCGESNRRVPQFMGLECDSRMPCIDRGDGRRGS